MRFLPRLPDRLPGTVASMLGIRPGEKVVAWGSTPGADATQTLFTAATDRALYLQEIGERLPWDRISKATWEEPWLELVVVDEAGQPARLVRVGIDEARDLPAAVHDRVTASVVVSEHVDLGGGAGARLVARRGSDEDVIRWSIVFDSGLDHADPALRRAADLALADLRSALGI
jgi:hypothetical protein